MREREKEREKLNKIFVITNVWWFFVQGRQKRGGEKETSDLRVFLEKMNSIDFFFSFLLYWYYLIYY